MSSSSVSLGASQKRGDVLRALYMRSSCRNQHQILLLSQLEIFDLSNNDITIIPETIKSMTSHQSLVIMRSKTVRLPLALGLIRQLRLIPGQFGIVVKTGVHQRMPDIS